MNTIILTGANRGLGKAIHDILCKENIVDEKIFISRSIVSLMQSANLASYIVLDFSQEALNVELITVDSKSECVIFINNAGTIEPIDIATKLNRADIEKSIRINCLAPFQLAQHLTLITNNAETQLYIVNISSGAANRPIKGWMAYCLSKASAKMAFDVLAAENEHVEVLHFDPGVMDTEMQTVIRSQPKDNMPDVKAFQELKSSEKLKDPVQVAQEIVKIIKGFK